MRLAGGKSGYAEKRHTLADDRRDADGVDLLDFWQAQNRARKFASNKATVLPVTLGEALAVYERVL